MARARPFAPEAPDERPCRRERSRLRTSLPARLTTLGGVFTCEMLDLSLTGARVRIVNRRGHDKAMAAGERAMVEWEGFEAFGTVRWERGDTLGLRFWDIITPATLVQTRDRQDAFMREGGTRTAERSQARAWVEGLTRRL